MIRVSKVSCTFPNDLFFASAPGFALQSPGSVAVFDLYNAFGFDVGVAFFFQLLAL